MAATISNLVLEGGGVKAIAYAGAIEALESRGFMAGVRGVAGTSAGALTAMMLSLGADSTAIKQFIRGTDFKGLEDHFDPLRLATRYGLYAGGKLLDWITGGIESRGHDPAMTFADLERLGGRDLRVYATDLTTRDAREFSFRATPRARVAGAVRASMSIPLMFAAWQFADGEPDDHVYIDGGAVLNYPIDAFDAADAIDPGTLGLRLYSGSAQPPPGPGFDHPLGYARALFECLLGAQSIDVLHAPAMLARTVQIEDYGLSATDFNLTDADYERLFQSGRSATLAYLDAAHGASA